MNKNMFFYKTKPLVVPGYYKLTGYAIFNLKFIVAEALDGFWNHKGRPMKFFEKEENGFRVRVGKWYLKVVTK